MMSRADRDQARFDGLDDIVATTGQVFLGLTVDCARCHDHKIDPIPQRDYYRLLSFFHNINPFHNGGPGDELPLDPAERGAYRANEQGTGQAAVKNTKTTIRSIWPSASAKPGRKPPTRSCCSAAIRETRAIRLSRRFRKCWAAASR